MKNIIKYLCFPILGVVIALLFAEVFISRFWPQETLIFQKDISPACFAESDILPFELKKSAICLFQSSEFNASAHINKLGYRGNDFEYESKDGRLRVLIVGDSFTFGHGVSDDQTYSVRLDARFEDENAEVINAGYASGFSPDSYYLYLKKKGIFLKPSIVVMGLFVWNDISDLSETDWVKVDRDGLPEKIVSRFRKVGKVGHLEYVKARKRYQIAPLANSHLFQLIYSHKQSFFDKLFLYFDQNPEFDPEKMAASIYDTCIFETSCFRRYDDNWEKFQKVILATKILLDKNNIKLLVVIIPTKEQLGSGGCCGWEKLSSDERLSLNKKLSSLFDQNGIYYLDLYNKLNQSEDNLYFDHDAHWTSKGHDIAAKSIYEYTRTILDY